MTFCAYTVFSEKKGFSHTYSMRDEAGEELLDSLNVVFVELTKLKDILLKPVEEMTTLEMWSLFLQYVDKEEYNVLIDKIAQRRGEIKMAKEALIHVSQDERERAINRSRRMWQNDYESNMNTSRAIGLEEGKLEIAKNLRAMGMDDKQIAQVSGLTVEVIRLKLGS